MTYHVQEGFASDKLMDRSCSYACVVHIKRSQCRFCQSKYSIINEGENLISAIRSDSPREAVSEMRVLQFASKGREVRLSRTLVVVQAVEYLI